MTICFIVPGAPVRQLCNKQHKPGSKSERNCKRHTVPRDAIWQGDWPEDEFGDLKADVKYQRNEYRKLIKRQTRQLQALVSVRPAPAFAAYHRDQIEKMKAAMTGFKFQPRRKPVA